MLDTPEVFDMRILNADEVKSVLNMSVCMDALEEAYRENALGAATSQRRRHIHSTVEEPDRLYRFKVFEGVIEKSRTVDRFEVANREISR